MFAEYPQRCLKRLLSVEWPRPAFARGAWRFHSDHYENRRPDCQGDDDFWAVI